MQFNSTVRERNGSTQVIVSYKDKSGVWRQKSKQVKKILNEKETDEIIYELKKIVENDYSLNKNYVDYTFEELSKAFLEQISLHREPNTYVNYKRAIEHFPGLNKMKVKDILPIDIQQCVNSMITLSPRTVGVYLTVIRSMFKSAITLYKIRNDNPAYNIIYSKDDDDDENFTDDMPTRALTQEEFENLVNGLTNPRHKLYTLLAGSCGLRGGEICGLTVNHIDFTNHLILVRRQWKVTKKPGVFAFGKLKSKNSKRDVPIPPAVEDFLKKYIDKKKLKDNDRILNYASAGSARTIMMISYRRLGYSNTVHDLRHTYATTLIANNLDLKTVAYLLGHDIKETMAIYSHVTSEMKEKANRIIQDIYSDDRIDTSYKEGYNKFKKPEKDDF